MKAAIMSQTDSFASTATWLETNIKRLENNVALNPTDKAETKTLMTLLDDYPPDKPSLGRYSEFQRVFAQQFPKETWVDEVFETDKLQMHCKSWLTVLATLNVHSQIIVAQIFEGTNHKIAGENSCCTLRMSLFDKTGVISRTCNHCFKVQILPANLLAHIQAYFIIRKIELPKNNARKSMIEVREDTPYPYKSYIYCESEDEAKICRDVFQNALRKHNISDVYCGISHGCSEFGAKYPSFKYSKDGTHRNFEWPEHWDETEAAFFEFNPRPENIDYVHFNGNLSIRDVAGFATWIDYAEMIGDETAKLFREKPNTAVPETFAARVNKQSQARHQQMIELRARIASAA